MSRRWHNVTRQVEYQRCASCGRETEFLVKGYALRIFRLDPIFTLREMFLGTVVRLVEAMVCLRCREANEPKPIPKPIGCQHCDCVPRWITCCYCKEEVSK